MTRLEDDLRSALRATAQQIPPGPPPPLTLPERRRQPRPAGRPRRARWSLGPGRRRWIVALGALVLIGAVVSGLQVLTPAARGHSGLAPAPAPPTATGPAGVPAYYVALSSASGDSPGATPPAAAEATATIRATGSGQVLAAITVPPPYRVFAQVAAGDDRTFVLLAEADQTAGSSSPGSATFPPARFYVLHFDPAKPAATRIQLQALPASYIPAGDTVLAMALSPDGTSLAATVGDLQHSQLYVYHLRTGARRVWTWFDCDTCGANTAVSEIVGPYPRPLSWTADGRTLLFVYLYGGVPGGQVRLLNPSAPGSNLLTDSKAFAFSLGGRGRTWMDAAATADGRTIAAVRETTSGNGQELRQQLVLFSATTGQPTATYAATPIGRDFEQIQWTDYTGRLLILTGAQPTRGAEILNDGRVTRIPWSSHIFDAAW